jgi:nudix-type nucleoside diphosphatase (YffH/AdpP family)
MGAVALAVNGAAPPMEDPRLADPRLAALIATGGGSANGAGDGAGDGAARLAFWRAATAGQAAPDPETELRLAADILAAMGQVPAERLRARRGPMLARAASALRAAEGAPARLRHPAGPGDVTEAPRETGFAGFFSVETLSLHHRRFDGAASGAVRREVFVACDAVTVLPWDARRGRVLLVEQLRAGPLARGEANPWSLEAIAGRIDPGETADQAARREAVEEAGLVLDRLVPVAAYYPSPGAMSEFLWSFVAPTDLPDGCAGLHGLAGEAEDIRGHLVPLETALDLVASGEIANAPLILTLYWLAANRGRMADPGI